MVGDGDFDDDIIDSMSNLSKGSDNDDMNQGWLSPRPRKTKKKNRKVVVATRTSQRIPKDGISITQKATSRAIAKNSMAGNNKQSNPFTVLSNTSVSLPEVLSDLNIVGDNVEKQIEVFKVEELARAALAEANYKVFLDKQIDRDKHDSDGCLEDVMMEVIDNTIRLHPVNNSTEEVAHEALKPNGTGGLQGRRPQGQYTEYVRMRIMFWNIRGLGKAYRRIWVKEHILVEDLDVVAIQETIKHDFSDFKLKEMAGNKDFCWLWVPSRGHSGGLITGIKVDDFDLEQSITNIFFVAILLRNRKTNYRFWLVNVYGPAQHNLSEDFILELQNFYNQESLPILMGGF